MEIDQIYVGSMLQLPAKGASSIYTRAREDLTKGTRMTFWLQSSPGTYVFWYSDSQKVTNQGRLEATPSAVSVFVCDSNCEPLF